jgi:hypothetical protein
VHVGRKTRGFQNGLMHFVRFVNFNLRFVCLFYFILFLIFLIFFMHLVLVELCSLCNIYCV